MEILLHLIVVVLRKKTDLKIPFITLMKEKENSRSSIVIILRLLHEKNIFSVLYFDIKLRYIKFLDDLYGDFNTWQNVEKADYNKMLLWRWC